MMAGNGPAVTRPAEHGDNQPMRKLSTKAHPGVLLRAFVLVLPFAASGCSDEAPKGQPPLTGLLNATEIDVASKTPGRIKALELREGDQVEIGQTLVTLESHEIAARLDQVQASIDAADAQVRLAKKGARKEEIEATRQAVEMARHQVGIADKTYARVESLFRDSAVPKAKLDEAEFAKNVAHDRLAMAEAKYKAVRKGARKEEIQALEAMVRKGRSTLAEVQSYEAETVQRAPIAGEVSKIILHPGELAATGYPILTLVDLDDQWASFAVREDLLQKVKTGEEHQIWVPALGRNVPMRITHIAALGDFATWRATSERDSFDLKSFEVKMRPTDPIPEKLRPGMSVRWSLEP